MFFIEFLAFDSGRFANHYLVSRTRRRLGCVRPKDSTALQTRKTLRGQHLPPSVLAVDLENLNVLCLPALGPTLDVEAHCLAFLQRTETVRLDGREVHEYVFAILTRNKAKSLGIVKPL